MRTVNSSIGMHIQAVNKVLGIDRIYLKYRRNSDRFSQFPPDIIRTAGRKSNGQSQADVRAKVPSSRKAGVARKDMVAFNAKNHGFDSPTGRPATGKLSMAAINRYKGRLKSWFRLPCVVLKIRLTSNSPCPCYDKSREMFFPLSQETKREIYFKHLGTSFIIGVWSQGQKFLPCR